MKTNAHRYVKELRVAIRAAKAAGLIQQSMQCSLPGFRLKKDHSPVTVVDGRCEALLRERLLTPFPRDGFLGEETGSDAGTSGRRWIVDPLDGTRPYIRGIPTYSVLLALEENNQPVVGVIHLPAQKQTYWATQGSDAFLNGTPIHVSRTSAFDKAMGSALGIVEQQKKKSGKNLLSLMGRLGYAYGFMDAYSYGCVAAGRLDCTVNLCDKPWDCAAAACIIEQAGGRFSDIHGNKTIYNGNIVFSNGLLHDRLIAHLAR